MFKLILGRAGTGKTTAVLSRLTKAGQRRKQVLIVPEQQSHEAERALCRAGGDRVSLYGEVLSFSRLANRVFLAAGGMGEPELDAGGRLLLMHQAVKAVSDQLTVYARPSRRPVFLESLLATADELKSSCVQPELLLQAGRELPGPEGEKLRDLGLICGTYQAMTARTALDPRDRLTRTAEKLKEHPWAQGMDLWLDGFTDFTPQQREVLRHLMRQADSLTVTLTCDHLEEDEGGAGIFSPARRTAAGLLRLAAQEGISCEVEHLVPDWDKRCEPLRQVEKQLFAHGEAEPVSCQGRVELLGALTPRSEVEQAAAGIRRLLRTQGLRCRDIGVTARDLSVYQPLVEAIFPRYQIPVFTSAMTDILDKPILTLVTAALDTVANGYRYDDVFRYLKTGLTDLPEEDRDLLENYVLKWNLRGSQWTQKKPWAMPPRGYGATVTDEDRALLERLDRARRQVAEPLELLRKNQNRTGVGQAICLYSFMEEIGLPQRLEDRVAELHRRDQPALAEEYRQLWEILCRGLEQCAALLGETPMELEEFSGLFRLVLSQYDVGTIPVSLDRVTVGETTRETGHPVKVLFLLGADDVSIPKAGSAPGLLSDEDRSVLAGYGLELAQSSGAALPGDDHGVPHLRTAVGAAGGQLAQPERRRGGAPPQLSGGAAAAAVHRSAGDAGGGLRRCVPSGGTSARPGAGGAESGGPAGSGRPAGVCPHGGAAGPGGGLEPGPAVPAGGGPAVRAEGVHVGLPDGQVQVLPFFLFHALWPPGGAPQAGWLYSTGVRDLCPLRFGARPPG